MWNADDIEAVVIVQDVELAQMRLRQVMRLVSSWMTDHGLKLAADKTEIVLIIKRHIPKILPLQVGEETVHTKAAIKYLGILLDTKLTFWPQIKRLIRLQL